MKIKTSKKPYPIADIYKNNIGAVRTGEKRCPMAGEYYLSGAIPCAYKALNNLSTEYHIVKPVLFREIVTYEIIDIV